MQNQVKRALVMAGGTGGHIMPGLAVAAELKQRGWEVKWLGNPEKMEGKLVPKYGFELLPMEFAGLRGKGIKALIKLPFTMLNACLSARKAIKAFKPDMVLGMGGYVSFPGALMAKFAGIPVVVHEQNAVAGTANKSIAKFAAKKLTGFPNVLDGGVTVGNPVRQALLNLAKPAERYGSRQGPLNVLVVGGSLGAMALNTLVPEAVAMLPEQDRPIITHQSGEQHLSVLQADYQKAGVEAKCVAFIDDMATALAETDLIICRAGAMTVAEVAAVGVAALFVPLPHAIDDHQTANAEWLSKEKAAFTYAQKNLNALELCTFLKTYSREDFSQVAQRAHQMAYTHATQDIADVCEQVAKVG
ncbi:UDP-N-acetylglucosamine--N-acetylmuramyl-(pentapeptide) pyrophosphoryl-UDP N-acetylglucosamine transferase [Pelistega indica]|uniref:UDP-N-acetylglucosamine--N-acetylmuramyl-(pentapeptide) pyrophosphoryl-undecaprenol N-acetylglucosamine transferase n=1 Tax=Pelistega indica TaxID=1414851 RepID=V8G8P4_9BURK|nr:undecaprenyldiphospho-muramoylpentapeptide beta-N-acetylglucosaminyltransferase [Pelistega indica]ETD72333.1 UDP-N-acetylglucosamine--N-acetylmuramyl-(pentapeptide) pyrophosphoryl-UDP N-acetylglucosamine transferase [Pelistega indica]